MIKHFMLVCLLAAQVFIPRIAGAQDTAANAMTLAEYEKSKSFTINDPDKDSYVKFENAYILDRNDFGKPYYITGDDGMKKRIDLYKLIRKEGRIELGTVIFYTTEKGKRYSACMPSYKTDGKIWEKYFEDIHAIEKEEKNYVLKLSYVLSKELGFQMYRAANMGSGKDPMKEREAGTYGNDICFPGSTLVTMADGGLRELKDIHAGDKVVTVDPQTYQATTVEVRALTAHEEKNYAITRLLLVDDEKLGEAHRVLLHAKWLEATPNHPMVTLTGKRRVGDVAEGEELVCIDEKTGHCRNYKVWYKTESAGGVQKVYNIVAGGGSTFMMNGVMVSQK